MRREFLMWKSGNQGNGYRGLRFGCRAGPCAGPFAVRKTRHADERRPYKPASGMTRSALSAS